MEIPTAHGMPKLNETATPIRQTRDSIADIWGPRTPYHGAWPERVDERIIEEPERWVQSACVLCSNGCAMDIGVRDGRIVGVRGRAVDRINRGRLGPKGLHGWIANHSPDRLTTPLVRRFGNLRETTWENAMEYIVFQSQKLLKTHGPGAIGFYNSGQLFLEEYYTLGVIARAGVRTPHIDGNTRLCTATAAMALIESFGTDGDPGSYEDIDVTDAIMHVGHNIAFTQTVLWSRILDRLHGPNPPRLIVIDPRRTDTAKQAAIHLAPRVGTNVALLNGLLNQLIAHDWIDHTFVDRHTVGFDDLQQTVSKYSPEWAERLTGVPRQRIEEAAELIGTTRTLVSTVLQGVYQSMQATAAAVQVNNVHLLRGLIGKPGSTVFQMNGQPTAQNTRECGANGELVAFRNWQNPEHVKEIADLWNVDAGELPNYAPPTHAMQIFRYAEEGSLRMLWIIGTNPAVSLPELARIRKILSQGSLFVIAQDAFLTETAAMADVVLPVAIWGEKTGCFTNADRTLHMSQKAIDPPGEAKSDLDIFLEYARRMNFRDKAGNPLIKWNDSESAFEAFKQITRGRPCDYTGFSYQKLSVGSGIQWPCNEANPEGTPRLYSEGVFNTGYRYCELYGHDLVTGAAQTPEQYQANDPAGKAILKAAEYLPPTEEPDTSYPFMLTTGRLVYHWHTRTKTGRSPELNAAAPNVFVEMAESDARAYSIKSGDLVEISSRRGQIRARARIGGIAEGHLFVPFHYGYWDRNDGTHRRAANEMTITGWDPVSKQPHFKFAAVRIKKIGG
jgi:anaerobic selenocysteine-containing dehydrogenase